MTAAIAEGTRRARILVHLEAHPGLTAGELERALGTGPSTRDLLLDMLGKGQVIRSAQWRPQQGRDVSLWFAAPAGTVPPPRADAERRRRRAREAQRRRRARARGTVIAPGARTAVSLPPGAACRGADPALFFGAEGEQPEDRQAREAAAKAICARCPVRRQCYDLARAHGEPWGIWGGADFETENRPKGRRAS